MVEQRGEAWVKSASPEQITAALEAGELATYLGGKTDDQKAVDARVASAPDRILAEAYGLASVKAANGRDSTWFEAKRRDMTPEQLEKLTWIETASPAEVLAAEQAGELDHLTGRDLTKQDAHLADVGQRVRDSMSAAGVGSV